MQRSSYKINKLNNKRIKLVTVLLAILVVGVIAGAGWFVWERKGSIFQTGKSTNDTEPPTIYERTATIPAEWKTYTDEKYNFKFKYPANLSISTNTISKKPGEAKQNVYGNDATEIFVICLMEKPRSQVCVNQININNQPFSKSVEQMRNHYTSSKIPVKETKYTIDGHELIEFSVDANKEFLLNANGYTYAMTHNTDSKQKRTPGQLSEEESLAIFESIIVE